VPKRFGQHELVCKEGPDRQYEKYREKNAEGNIIESEMKILQPLMKIQPFQEQRVVPEEHS
jgi:hypothetical protein